MKVVYLGDPRLISVFGHIGECATGRTAIYFHKCFTATSKAWESAATIPTHVGLFIPITYPHQGNCVS